MCCGETEQRNFLAYYQLMMPKEFQEEKVEEGYLGRFFTKRAAINACINFIKDLECYYDEISNEAGYVSEKKDPFLTKLYEIIREKKVHKVEINWGGHWLVGVR